MSELINWTNLHAHALFKHNHLFTTGVPWVWHDPPMQTYWKLRSYLPAFQLHSLMFSRHILYLTDLSTLSGRLTRRMSRSLICPQNHKTVLHLSQNLFINIENTKNFNFCSELSPHHFIYMNLYFIDIWQIKNWCVI